ncbi:hypothetical protein [Chlamydia suis]|uniref:hypothetical protein n=1 Tax=Chlamydia suis TaxID=83559 RepID=UPI0011789C0A|nr:hypothetical protein [Chlamydia suis]
MAFPASNNCGNGCNSTDRVIYIGDTSSDSEESDASFSQETYLNAVQTTALRVNFAVLGTRGGGYPIFFKDEILNNFRI